MKNWPRKKAASVMSHGSALYQISIGDPVTMYFKLNNN